MNNNLIKNVRTKNPIVLSIANTITSQHVADAINFIGGSPMMPNDPEEITEMSKVANAVCLNLGSTNPDMQLCSLLTAKQTNSDHNPVIFDPVAVGATKVRYDRSMELLQQVKVDIIRGNTSEIAALTGVTWENHGIDAVDGNDSDRKKIAQAAAKQFNCRIMISGPTDIITDGQKVFEVKNDEPMLKTNVGMGDVLDGILAVFASQKCSLEDLTYASAILPVVAELAAKETGNQATAFMNKTFDILGTLDDKTLQDNIKIVKVK